MAMAEEVHHDMVNGSGDDDGVGGRYTLPDAPTTPPFALSTITDLAASIEREEREERRGEEEGMLHARAWPR